MLKLLLMPFVMIFKIIWFPFKMLFSLFGIKREDRNDWDLSKEDKRIAKEERMTDADYVEAEERDDDNLDTDDDW